MSTETGQLEQYMTNLESLKAALDAATAAWNDELERLTSAGLNSKERNKALEPLKADVDTVNSLYIKAFANKVKRALAAQS